MYIHSFQIFIICHIEIILFIYVDCIYDIEFNGRIIYRNLFSKQEFSGKGRQVLN